MEKTERPQERYDRLYSKKYMLKVNKRTEADIIAKLEAVPNKQGYIKELIRRDIQDNSMDDMNTGELLVQVTEEN